MTFTVDFRSFALWLAIWTALACQCVTVARAQDPIAPDLIRTVELTWEEIPEAREYEIELATDPDFKSPLYSQRVQGTKFNADLLAGNYFYRVRALDVRSRPGRWTPITELSINPRPPVLMWPANEELVKGNLPDTGLPLQWRTSGPGVRYIIEIRSPDEKGEFTNTVARQEVNATSFPFFPQEIGKYQWEVHTLGPAGDEPGMVWTFEIEGVFPPDLQPGEPAKRIVRYVSPWYRNHWWLYARYGQSQMTSQLVDIEHGSSSQIFNALTGYIDTTLYWEWHDPTKWTGGGYPWFSFDFELQRQTVLTESTILNDKSAHFGSWYTKWIPILEILP